MDNSQGFSREDLARYEKMLEMQKKASSNLASYYEMMKDLSETQRNLNHLQKTSVDINKKIEELKKRDLALDKKGVAKEDERRKILEKELAIAEQNLQINIEGIKNAELLRRTLSESLNTTKLMGASTRTMVAGFKMAGKATLNQLGYLLEQQKSVKVAGFNMGILSKQADTFRNTLYQASLSTNAIGVDTKMLAEMQANYSEGIGRAVTLNEEGLKSMAALAKGTVLGAEGAAELVTNMDNFNISAKGSADIIQTMLNDAHKMGVDGAAVTKAMANNLKMANKYHFKDGIKGLAKMASLATKFKLDMKSVGEFADKLFDIEGAVEMSAQLQVLGGNWAALGDPFQLMFKARNDMEGLTKDIIKATEVTGTFNKATGEIQMSALEMSRLREAAKATGIEYEELAKTAGEVNKNTEKNRQARGITNKDDLDYLNTLAQYDKNKGKFYVKIDGKEIMYDELYKINSQTIKKLKDEKATLDERAKTAQTFDETWGNIMNTLKTALLPGFESFANSLSDGLGTFQNWMKENKVVESITEVGKTVGKFAAMVIRWVAENPIKSMMAGVGLLIAKEATWFLRGQMLGAGFNSVASAGGIGTGGIGGIGASTTAATLAGKGLSGKYMGGFGKALAGKGMGIGIVGGLAGAGLEYGRSQMDDPNSGGGKALGVGAKALEWGATGAMLGSIIPGLGTAAGGVIGGILGAGVGAYDEGLFGNGTEKKQNDFISRPGSKPIPFSSADTLIGMKKDGGLGKNFVEGGSSKGGNSVVTFGNPLQINGKITVESGNNFLSMLL